MKITKVETIQAPDYNRYLWVRIHTDTGIIGLGETYIHTQPVRSLIESVFAPEFLLGQNPLEIERLWRVMFDRVNYAGWAGAEMRAISAIDIALWDILGQVSRLPIYQLLGGRLRERIKVYNTCGPEPGFDFQENPVELAEDLLANGVQVMKLYPFDPFALQSGGQYLSQEDLQRGLEPLRNIREALGDQMDVAVEFHGHWNLPIALRIVDSIEPFKPLWLEDIMQPDNLDAYERLSRATRLPLAVSERLQTRYQYLPVFQRGIAGIANPDVEWCGGISEAKKIASLAEAYQVPVAFHNYGGPILNFASAQVAASCPNLMLLETGRDLLAKWNNLVITNPVVIRDGYMRLPESPGLGVALSPALLSRSDLLVSSCET